MLVQVIVQTVTDNEVTVTGTGLTNANLNGSAGITNANLANPTITLGSSTLTLGATTTDIAGLTSLVVDSITINGSTISTTASNTDITLSLMVQEQLKFLVVMKIEQDLQLTH